MIISLATKPYISAQTYTDTFTKPINTLRKIKYLLYTYKVYPSSNRKISLILERIDSQQKKT